MAKDVAGIYQIRNLINGKLYVGSSVDLERRQSHHFLYLKLGKHHNSYLQRAFDKHGNEAFLFEVIEVVDDVQRLIEREQFWIDTRSRDGELYNLSPTAGNQLGIKRSEETKRRMSESLKGRRLTEEHKAKLAKAKIGTAFRKGKLASAATKKRVSEGRKGKGLGNRNAVGGFATPNKSEEQLWLQL